MELLLCLAYATDSYNWTSYSPGKANMTKRIDCYCFSMDIRLPNRLIQVRVLYILGKKEWVPVSIFKWKYLLRSGVFFERLENSSIAIVAVLKQRKVGTGEGNLGLSVHEHYLFKSSWKWVSLDDSTRPRETWHRIPANTNTNSITCHPKYLYEKVWYYPWSLCVSLAGCAPLLKARNMLTFARVLPLD